MSILRSPRVIGSGAVIAVAAALLGAQVVTSGAAGAVPAAGAPTGLQATPGPGSVSFSWTAVAGATSYSVYGSATSGGEDLNGGATCSSTTTSCGVTGTTDTRTLYYVVVANSATGQSAPSNEVSAAVLSGTPSGGGGLGGGGLGGGGTSTAPAIVISSSANPSVSTTSLTFTATLSPAPACGTVSWLIDNATPSVGATTSNGAGTAVLSSVTGLAIGVHQVTAVYSGCATAAAVSGTIVQQVTAVSPTPTPTPTPSTHPVVNPLITAAVTSGQPKTNGWYRAPVSITFSCLPGSAPLAYSCPAPVTLIANKNGGYVTARVAGTDGGVATVTVGPFRIDTVAPTLRVTGAHAKHCVATDTLSGVASCVIDRLRHNYHGVITITWIATATDVAGNTTYRQGSYRLD
ncbi:MAG TPA: hypothetical protein VHW74_12900 [Mycobacteriales bacterium]|nr:hypothetical protein [Mycobacteriales bacterium]